MLQTIPLAGTNEELQMVLVTLPPGAKSEPHVHPVAGMGYIVEGSVESQYEGEEKRLYQSGDSFLDLAGKAHLIFRNTSQTQQLRFLIAYKIEKGVAFKQDLAR